ncbi:MAG: hypothetical protein DLM68_14765 [Hyphomicrobiales bacterium]|nr:MAG: hypothetical protein DLM68_14765 [Hyphomicrobiales bacterium]
MRCKMGFDNIHQFRSHEWHKQELRAPFANKIANSHNPATQHTYRNHGCAAHTVSFRTMLAKEFKERLIQHIIAVVNFLRSTHFILLCSKPELFRR